jgi:hypothetical protein
MQTFHDDDTYRPENTITAMMYDNTKRWLVTGNTTLKVSWPSSLPYGNPTHPAALTAWLSWCRVLHVDVAAALGDQQDQRSAFCPRL